MIRLILWVVGFTLAVGIAPKLIDWTFQMATLAVQAQRHDQMSYARFNRALWIKHR